MSAAPAPASSSSASQSRPVRPKPTMQPPQARIAASTARPCRCTRPNQPPNSAPSRAPAASALYIAPAACSPPWNTWSASGANSDRGMPNTIATMSTTKVMSSTLRVRRKRSPSTTLASPARRPPPSGAIAGRDSTAAIEAAKDTASSPYAAPKPNAPMRKPASSGPPAKPTLNSTCRSAFPAGSSSLGSSRGTKADRAGESSANRPAWAATIAYSSQTCWEPARACASRTVDSPACAVVVASTSRRRSTASATAPPYRPRTTSGTRPARPTRPTAAAERVRA